MTFGHFSRFTHRYFNSVTGIFVNLKNTNKK